MNKKLLTASVLALGLLSSTAFATNGTTRLELGIGAHWGDPELEYQGSSADLDTDTGLAITGGIWFDDVGTQNVSLGIEYMHLRDGDYSESGTISDGVITASGTLSIEPEINALMINAAYRDNRTTTRFHPYAGVGAGAAWVSADVSFNGTVTVGGTTFSGGSDDDDDLAFAWQLYVGADYDITDRLYIGAGALTSSSGILSHSPRSGIASNLWQTAKLKAGVSAPAFSFFSSQSPWKTGAVPMTSAFTQ